MAIKGSCLCGTVSFEIDRADGPFEICHCSRCRKVTGANGMYGISVKKEHFRFLSGEDHIGTWEAPILYAPPAYVSTFCKTCGSVVPLPGDFEEVEIPAGLFDDDPGIVPDRHIYIEYKPKWDGTVEREPTFTREEIYKYRTGKDWPL